MLNRLCCGELVAVRRTAFWGDQMDEVIEPIGEVPTNVPSMHAVGPGSQEARKRAVTGVVVAVHRRRTHQDGDHRLDVTVGAEEHDEIVIRVESGPFIELEGKRVVLFLD